MPRKFVKFTSITKVHRIVIYIHVLCELWYEMGYHSLTILIVGRKKPVLRAWILPKGLRSAAYSRSLIITLNHMAELLFWPMGPDFH